MIGQPSFNVKGSLRTSGSIFSSSLGDLGASNERYGDLYLTGTGYFDEVSARNFSSQTATIQTLTSPQVSAGTGSFYNLQTESQICESGVFNYLNPTGRFFPPILTFSQRTGIYTGSLVAVDSPYDGLMVYQNPDQSLYIVQSGMWKKVNLV
jgi:hypothetical protein